VRRKQPRHWSYHQEKLLKPILVRDNFECQIRGPMCLGLATTVDHIHPKAWGGRATPDNLRAACKPCNLSKGARTDEQAFFRGEAARTRPVLPQRP
jgi:5-methylcytosine-specific restriction endonuclease McrA